MFKNIIKHVSWQFGGRIVSSFFAFLTTLLLAKYLGGDRFGEYITATSFVALFYLGVDFGLNPLFLKESKLDKLPEFSTLLILRLIVGGALTVLAMLIGLLLAPFYAGFSFVVQKMIFIMSFSIVAYGLQTSALVVFQAKLRFDLFALVSLCTAFSFLLFVYLFRDYFSTSVGGTLASLFLSASVWLGGLLGLYFVKNQGVVFIKTTSKLWQKLLLLGWPLGLTLVLNTLYFRIGTLVLAAHEKPNIVGTFGLAFKFFEFGIVLPTLVMNSLYPNLLKNPKTKSWSKLLGALLVTALLATGVFYLSSPLLVFIKTDYARSIETLRSLSLLFPLFYLTTPLTYFAVINNQQRKLIYIYGLALFITTVLNFCWVPTWSVNGTIAALAAGEASVLMGGLLLMKGST